MSIRQLLETIGNLVGRGELVQFGVNPYRDWEPPFICGDNSKLKGLGWQPNYSLYNGLLQTIQKLEMHNKVIAQLSDNE